MNQKPSLFIFIVAGVIAIAGLLAIGMALSAFNADTGGLSPGGVIIFPQ